MTYSETLTLTVPVALAAVAAAIGRHFDFDVGGDKSFRLSEDGLTVAMSTNCRPEFKAQALYMLNHPEAAYEFCRADGEARWSGVYPTLEDVQAFCAAALESMNQSTP